MRPESLVRRIQSTTHKPSGTDRACLSAADPRNSVEESTYVTGKQQLSERNQAETGLSPCPRSQPQVHPSLARISRPSPPIPSISSAPVDHRIHPIRFNTGSGTLPYNPLHQGDHPHRFQVATSPHGASMGIGENDHRFTHQQMPTAYMHVPDKHHCDR